MDEKAWLDCTDPRPMIGFLIRAASDRKLRLFACACCRRIWHLLSNEIGRSAVQAAGLHADGLISNEELNGARARAEVARVNPPVPDSAAFCTTWVDNWPSFPMGRIVLGVDDAPLFAARFSDNYGAERIWQATIVRDLFGNPFRPVTLAASCLTTTVKSLAQAIYEERNFTDMPVLADALEDAGCTNAEILTHCREAGDHARGCWGLDLILGKG